MRRPSHELIDRLAAEFVLGTLRGPARTRFARWLDDRDPAHRAAVRAAVYRWEDRLVHLADDVAPVDPAPRVWREIKRRTQPATSRWQGLAIAASLLAAVLGTWTWQHRESEPQWQAAAELREPAATATRWHIETDEAGSRLRVRAGQPFPLKPGEVHELWALADGGAAPVSLGLLPESGELEMNLSDAQRAALGAARQLAVSREPAGGSPTGAPTGPVLLVVPRLPTA